MRILLVCCGGISTALLVKKLQTEAASCGLNPQIRATGVVHGAKAIQEADVCLFGPQLKAQMVDALDWTENRRVPIDMISPEDFKTMNAKRILEHALNMLQTQN